MKEIILPNIKKQILNLVDSSVNNRELFDNVSAGVVMSTTRSLNSLEDVYIMGIDDLLFQIEISIDATWHKIWWMNYGYKYN